MAEMKPNAPPPQAGGPKSPVIRMVEAAEETSQERLMKKHVPAWVISGAMHVGLIAVLILVLGGRVAESKPDQTVIATAVTKQEEPPKEDLTNDDLGLDSDIPAALPDQPLDDKTVESKETEDNLGIPDAPSIDDQAMKLPGIDLGDVSVPGVTGDTGNVLSGLGGAGGNVFASFPGRGGATKEKLVREGGGNDESERAVAMGLAWLARQQQQDGGWIYDGARKEERIAATGMALLPFLAAGETHIKAKKYKRNVKAALLFLIQNCPVSGPRPGKMTDNMYAQAIGTMALCEAYGMTKDSGLLRNAAQAAINYIQVAQGPDGSWGYGFQKAGDTSIVGWQVQALTAAKLGGLVVNDVVLKRATMFLDKVGKGSSKAEYGYRDANSVSPTRSAVGLLSRYYIDAWDPTHSGMVDGVALLMKRPPNETQRMPEMYFHYYATQVVHFYGGDDWKTWNEGPKGQNGKRSGGMRDWLVSLQQKQGNDRGSWEPDSGWIGRSCGRLGTTAMCVLTLEVYYRHLPLYKRHGEEGGLKIIDAVK